MSEIKNKGGGGNVTQKTIHPKGGPAGLGKIRRESEGYSSEDNRHSTVPKHIKTTKRMTKKYSKDSGSKHSIGKGKQPVNPIAPVRPVRPVTPAPGKKKP